MKEKAIRNINRSANFVWKHRAKFIAGVCISAAIAARVMNSRRA